MRKQLCVLSAVAILGLGMAGFAQQGAQTNPGSEPKSVVLLFREDFKSGVPNYFVDITRWRALNPMTVAEAQRKAGEPIWRDTIDLSKVDEIGFSDLMGGAGHNSQGNSGVDWIEVYGNPVKR